MMVMVNETVYFILPLPDGRDHFSFTPHRTPNILLNHRIVRSSFFALVAVFGASASEMKFRYIQYLLLLSVARHSLLPFFVICILLIECVLFRAFPKKTYTTIE